MLQIILAIVAQIQKANMPFYLSDQFVICSFYDTLRTQMIAQSMRLIKFYYPASLVFDKI